MGKDRIQVTEILVLILITGNDDTEWDFVVLTDLIFLLVLKFLLENDLLDLF